MYRPHFLYWGSIVFLSLFVLYPFGAVIWQSFWKDGEITLANYGALLDLSSIWHMGQSLLVTASSAILSTFLGLVLALTVNKSELPGRSFFALAALLPLVLPGFITALAYTFLFGRNGLVSQKLFQQDWPVYSWQSVLILQTLNLSSLTFLLISAGLRQIDSTLEETARTLGSSDSQVLFSITLPLLRPNIIGAFLLAFLRASADLSTPLIVGGAFDTLASRSYTLLIGTYDLGAAAALNSILFLICLAIYGLFIWEQHHDPAKHAFSGGQVQPLRLPRAIRWFLGGVSLIFSIIIYALSFSALLAAFTQNLGTQPVLTLEHIHGLFTSRQSIRNSFLLASFTSIVVSTLGLLIARLLYLSSLRGNGLIDALATLPFAIPGTFIGVGYAIAFNRPPLVLTGTWSILAICTIIRELPLAFRSSRASLRQHPPSVEEASARELLGKPPFITSPYP